MIAFTPLDGPFVSGRGVLVAPTADMHVLLHVPSGRSDNAAARLEKREDLELGTPVSKTDQDKQDHQLSPLSVAELTLLLAARGVHLTLEENLKGGVMSQVYAAHGPCGEPLVVKYTTDWVNEDPTRVPVSRNGQNVDAGLLTYLADATDLRVPKVFHHFEDVPITVMEDLRSSGFSLLSNVMMSGRLPLGSAKIVGRDLAAMQLALGRHPRFETNELASESYFERGLELRLAYPNDQEWYAKLERRFTQERQQLIAVDTHPKNAFVTVNDEVAWIDFGRSVWGDRDFALPNFLAHAVIYALVGFYERHLAASYLNESVDSYRQLLPIDDEVFCTYLAAEVMHRWAGKWIEGIDEIAKKMTLIRFGLSVFDRQIFQLDDLLEFLVSHPLGP